MNKKQKSFCRRWIKALRSGDYKQGYHALRSWDDKFCCLGVACDLLQPKIKWDKAIGYYYIKDYNGNYPPVSLFITATGLIGESMYALAIMNDQRKSFLTIADVIEESINKVEDDCQAKIDYDVT